MAELFLSEDELRVWIRRSLRRVPEAVKSGVWEATEELYDEAIRLSSGGFKLAQLRKMGHPYAKRHRRGKGGRFQSSPVPYGDAAVVNVQTGKFRDAWKMVPPRETEDGTRFVGGIRNDSDRSPLLRDGTKLMIRRPIEARLQEKAARIAERAVADAIAEKLSRK